MKFIIFFFVIFMSEGIKEAQAVIVNNPQPMFECVDARYDDEKFVCADSELSKLNKESNFERYVAWFFFDDGLFRRGQV